MADNTSGEVKYEQQETEWSSGKLLSEEKAFLGKATANSRGERYAYKREKLKNTYKVVRGQTGKETMDPVPQNPAGQPY